MLPFLVLFEQAFLLLANFQASFTKMISLFLWLIILTQSYPAIQFNIPIWISFSKTSQITLKVTLFSICSTPKHCGFLKHKSLSFMTERLYQTNGVITRIVKVGKWNFERGQKRWKITFSDQKMSFLGVLAFFLISFSSFYNPSHNPFFKEWKLHLPPDK